MNFKSIGFKAAVATAVVAGSAISMAPAEAGNLFPGAFNLEGKSSINVNAPTSNPFTISFSKNFSIANGVGSSEPAPSGVFENNLTGTPVVGSLTLKQVGATNEYKITSGLLSFVTGLKQETKDIVLDLTSGSLFGSITDQNNYFFIGSTIDPLMGKLAFAGNPSSAFAGVRIDVFQSLHTYHLKHGPSFTIARNHAEIGVQSIPTPALLPGLIGLGVAALRKRKSEESDVEAAETVKA